MSFMRHIFVAFVLLWVSMLEVCAQDVNSKIKAIFIYNFTKYIEWPENQKQGDFVIGVLGNSNPNLNKELDKMAALSKIGSRICGKNIQFGRGNNQMSIAIYYRR